MNELNGSGYPYGLVGPNIHPYAQILAVTDVFDAVTTNRVYRPGLLPHEGLEILIFRKRRIVSARVRRFIPAQYLYLSKWRRSRIE